MTNNYDNFDKLDASVRNTPLIKERVALVSSHMYKQFLEYQDATDNTNEMFYQMIDYLQLVVDNLKQSFSSRGVATQNIYFEKDSTKSIANVNIFWHKFSFTTRCNFQPQSLFREASTPILTGRIMALKGNYNDLLKNAPSTDEQMKSLLDEEVASLYVPADKTQNTIFKIKHRANREFYLTHVDAPKEFVLTVFEAVCGGSLYHEEGVRKTFNI